MMKESQKKLRKNRRVIYSDSDESDEGTYDRKSSTPSEAPSTSQKGNNVKQEGRCSASRRRQSQRQVYRTGHYEIQELMEMMNFLIDNHRISTCCSIETWQLMAREKSKRQPESLLKQFKKVLAPNITQILKTMCRIREKQLSEEFEEALKEARIFENPSSVSLARTISSSSVDSSRVEAASSKLQKSMTSKEPKTPMSSASRKSLDETVISESEEETDTKDARPIKVPPLFNGSASQQPVVEESSQSEIEESASVTSDIRITKEIGKSADAVSTPSIVPKTEPKEDEDDVVLIEAAAWSNETKLVEVKLLIEPPDESAVETVILPPVVNRQNDENNRQMQSVEEESRTELNGETEFSNCLGFDQDKPRSPSVPPNAGESHSVSIEEEKREKNHPTTPEAEIPSRTERKLKNESQALTPGTPPLQVDSSCRRNDVKQEKPCTSAPKIADSRANALEEAPVAPVEVDPRLALIDDKIYQEIRVLAVKLDLDEPKSSTTPEQKRQSCDSVPQNTPSHLRSPLQSPEISNSVLKEESPARSLKSPAKSPRRYLLIEVIDEPSTSTGIRGHGSHEYEQNHLSRQDDTDTDSDSEFSGTKMPPNVSLRVSGKELNSLQRFELQLKEMQNCIRVIQSAVPLNEADSTDAGDEETQLPPVRETRLKASMMKNSGMNVENSRKRSNAATGSDAHDDDDDDKCSELMRTVKKRKQGIANDDSHDESSSDDHARSESPCQSIKVWERMYGPITVGRRECRQRIDFKEDFSIERKELPEDSKFSQELLAALNDDMSYKIDGHDILGDLAILHYFICRPRDIRWAGGKRVFQKIVNLKWDILRKKHSEGLSDRFRGFIRGYIHEFGLPKDILNEFLYCEWQKDLIAKQKREF